MTWTKKEKPDHSAALSPEQEREKKIEEHRIYLAAQAPYRWISKVEDLLRRAFVPDSMIRLRVEAKAKIKNWSPEDCEAQILRACTSRDLLAHRAGRESAVRRWQSEPSDRYNDGPSAYRWRLAEIGTIIFDLGWLDMPEHPWKRRKEIKPGDLDQRERDADALAESMGI